MARWAPGSPYPSLSEDAEQALLAEPSEYVAATVQVAVGDTVVGPKAVRVKLKGQASFRPLGRKAAFKLKFAKSDRLLGLKKLTLNNMVQDRSMILGERDARSTGDARGHPHPGAPAPRPAPRLRPRLRARPPWHGPARPLSLHDIGLAAAALRRQPGEGVPRLGLSPHQGRAADRLAGRGVPAQELHLRHVGDLSGTRAPSDEGDD